MRLMCSLGEIVDLGAITALVHAAGARVVATACTYCQIQFDTVRDAHPNETEALPARLYPQLLGLALGLPHDSLGLSSGEAG